MFKAIKFDLEQQADVDVLNMYFEAAYQTIKKTDMSPREKALAITKLEESSMWATRGVAKRKGVE
jgi:hypothetical protein